MRGERPLVVFALVLLGVATAASCGEDEEPVTTVRGAGSRARRPVPPRVTPPGAVTPPKGAAPGAAAPVTDVGPFTYKPGRDPFQSYFDITGEQDIVTTLEPLQKFDLSKLKVVGIITGTVQPAAMIVDPNGKNHLVKRGTLLGPPRGRVARILSDRIVVEREYKDRLERVHKLIHELKIRPDEEQREARP